MILLILATILLISGLVTANVFLVAVVKVHARSGTDLTDYVSASNVHRTVQQARRGYILDRNGTIIAQDNVTYNIIAISCHSLDSSSTTVLCFVCIYWHSLNISIIS